MDEKFTHLKIMDDESSTWMKIFEKKILIRKGGLDSTPFSSLLKVAPFSSFVVATVNHAPPMKKTMKMKRWILHALPSSYK